SQAQRNYGLRNTRGGSSVTSCDKQGCGCGDAASQSCSEAGAAKTERLDQVSFTQHRTSHGPQCVAAIKKADGTSEIGAPQNRILHQDGKRQAHGRRWQEEDQK